MIFDTDFGDLWVYFYLTYVMIGGANPQLAIRSGQSLLLVL